MKLEIDSQLLIASGTFNSEKAGQDVGKPALVLNLTGQLPTATVAPFLGFMKPAELDAIFWTKSGDHAFPSLRGLPLDLKLKGLCTVKVGNMTINGATLQRLEFAPDVKGSWDASMQIYAADAPDNAVTWAYHNQRQEKRFRISAAVESTDDLFDTASDETE